MLNYRRFDSALQSSHYNHQYSHADSFPALPRNGFLKLLQMALRVRQDGLATFGIPCGSYVFLNLPTHQRTPECPFGDESKEYVALANQIGCRTALIIMVLICRAVYIFVEQPATSRLFISPYYVFIREVCQRLSIRFYNSFLSETKFVCVCKWTTIYFPVSTPLRPSELDGIFRPLQPEAITWMGYSVCAS